MKSFRKFCGTIWHFYFSRSWHRTFYFTARTPLCKYIGAEMLLTSCEKSGKGSLHCKGCICTLYLYTLGNWNTHCTKPEAIRRLKLLKSSCRPDCILQISKKKVLKGHERWLLWLIYDTLWYQSTLTVEFSSLSAFQQPMKPEPCIQSKNASGRPTKRTLRGGILRRAKYAHEAQEL